MSSSTLERAAGPAGSGTGTARTAPDSRSGVPTTGRGAGRARAVAPSAPTTSAGAKAASSRTRVRAGLAGTAPEATGGTAPFVLLIMVLLTTGLVATLWLSTAAAADSYRLDAARQATRDRTEEVERLHRDVAAMQSAPALAASAQRIGMVPAGPPAVILVHPDGTSQVVGTPAKARAAAPPPPLPATVNPASPPNPAARAGGSPDPEALANDPASGVQASTGGAPAPAPAGAGTTTAPTAPGGR
jgi:hypothetical protein